MLRYVYGHKDVPGAVAQMIPRVRERGFGKCVSIGVIDEAGNLIGGAVYHNHDPDSGIIEMSCAAIAPRWLNLETLARLAYYPFGQLHCQQVMMLLDPDDERSQRILAACGFVLITIPRMLGRDRDGVLALLTDDAWIEGKFHQRLLKTAAKAEIEEAA